MRREARETGEDVPSLNDFVVKAAAAALREFPRFNASYVDGKVECYSRVNVGVAVATDDALLVPVVLDADRKPLAEIAADTRRLADAARRRALEPDDLRDGTFTVSNLGMFGVRSFTAIIDPPQVAILAVGGARRAPVEDGPDRVAFRDLMTVTLTLRPPCRLRRRRRASSCPGYASCSSDRSCCAVVMPTLAFRTAIRDALDEELAADERVILFGEDIAVAGGVFATTTGLYDKYGPERVFDTPISELALAGAAFGSAVHGLRPVVEIMFGDFLTLAMDSLVNQSTKYWFLTQEQVSVPLVIRSVVGAGGRFGAIHSQMPVSWFMGVPGLKIVCPSTPADAKALLKAAIRDDNPVLFFEHKRLYTLEGEVDGAQGRLGRGGRGSRGARRHARHRDEERPRRPRGRGRARAGRRVGRGDRPADAPPVRPRDRPRLGPEDEPHRGRRGRAR